MRSSALMALAAFVIVIAGVKAAQVIMVPFLLAVFIAIISAPLLLLLEKLGMPRILSFLIVLAGVVGIMMGVGMIVGNSMNGFLSSLPEIQRKLSFVVNDGIAWLKGMGVPIDMSAPPQGFDPSSAITTAGAFLRSMSQILSNSFLIFLMVTFMLFETVSMRAKVSFFAQKNPENLHIVETFIQNLKRYLAIKTVASFATGVLIGVVLSAMGVKYALLWGLLAFLLNYIPTIGSILAAIPAVLVTLVELDVGAALWVLSVFVAVNVAIGNFIEPRFLGRGLGISTLMVVVSLLFWGWVLGPAGMFLAVPLTMSVKIALDANPRTRWIAMILSDYRGETAASKAEESSVIPLKKLKNDA
ncbi:MAG: AI-2E family transporter [Campylobacterales bacterium]|nr:AI-2E family transporter [Campylobacterales bacterium]